ILSLLTLVLLALSKMTFLREKPPAAKLAPAAVPVPVAAGAAAALNPNDPHTKVVLAAAAHVARHLPVIAAAAAIEVLGTTSSLQLNPPDTSWAGAGRQAIFASHATRG
ncbi:MAG: hypothetical protein LBR07_01035, partial [Puniceicoccales bacterium]|nr:hypothetical protein [Puniceicoccales bacterium]